MKPLVRNTILMAISFAIIGAGLTAIDANVAQALGFSETLVTELSKNSAAWMGTFFGMFGAASVLVPAAVQKLPGLREKNKEASQDMAQDIAIDQGQGLAAVVAPDIDNAMPQRKTAQDYGLAEGGVAKEGANKCPPHMKEGSNGCPSHADKVTGGRNACPAHHSRG